VCPTNCPYGLLRDRGRESRAVVRHHVTRCQYYDPLSAMTGLLDLPMPYTTDRFYIKISSSS